jgi:DNA-binding transcriptional ArsR family regulator
MVVGYAGPIDVDEAWADLVFGALADRTRRDILRRSLEGALSVSALARNYEMSVTAVQKHVAVLDRAGLVAKRRRGREQLVRTDLDAIRAAQQLLDRFEVLWRDRIDRFTDVLDETTEGAGT